MPYVILTTHSICDQSLQENPHDFAIVELTPELAQTALERVQTFQTLEGKDSKVTAISYQDESVTFLFGLEGWVANPKPIDNPVLKEVTERGFLLTNEKPDIPKEDFLSTRSASMIVAEDGVTWAAAPKEHSEYLSTNLTLTEKIPTSLLKEVAGEVKPETTMKPLWKATLVIWSEWDPQKMEIVYLAQEAHQGDAYCSAMKTQYIADPTQDPDWDGTEFFNMDDDTDDADDKSESN